MVNPDSVNEIFNLTPIGRVIRGKDERRFGEKFRVPWYFDTYISKGFLLFLLVMTFYAIIRIIFTGFWWWKMNEKDQKAVMKLIMKLEIEIKTKLIEFEERLKVLEKSKNVKWNGSTKCHKCSK